MALLRPRVPHALIISPSEVTRSLFANLLDGFRLTLTGSVEEAEDQLKGLSRSRETTDFVIIDYQPDYIVNELTMKIRDMQSSALMDTKIVHLYTPTSEALLQQNRLNGTTMSGVMRMTKPPRKARLLQTLASLKDITGYKLSKSSSDVTQALDNLQAAQRTLFGNVLIAEGL